MPNQWLFSDPSNVAVLTTRKVTEQLAPILLVCHDLGDGAWQFHTNQGMLGDEPKIVSLERVVELDPSLQALYDLPLGWAAKRDSVHTTWIRFPQETH